MGLRICKLERSLTKVEEEEDVRGEKVVAETLPRHAGGFEFLAGDEIAGLVVDEGGGG